MIAFTLCHKSSNQIFDQCDIPGLGPADSLLDFGCGTGETTIAMAQVGHFLDIEYSLWYWFWILDIFMVKEDYNCDDAYRLSIF